MVFCRIFLIPALLFTTSSAFADADRNDRLDEGSWYLGFRTGMLTSIDSTGQFAGPSQSVYGGSPLVEMDDGLLYAVSVGHEIFAGLRLELELSYVTSDSHSGPVPGKDLRQDDLFRVRANVDSYVLMAKLGYDFGALDWWANPYIRGGIGIAETRSNARVSIDYNSQLWMGTQFEGLSVTDQDFAKGTANELAWEFSAGFKRNLTDRWTVRLEYSLLDRGDAWTGLNEDGDAIRFSDLESQQVLLGIEWQFQ